MLLSKPVLAADEGQPSPVASNTHKVSPIGEGSVSDAIVGMRDLAVMPAHRKASERPTD
jgi:hypothetical protein